MPDSVCPPPSLRRDNWQQQLNELVRAEAYNEGGGKLGQREGWQVGVGAATTSRWDTANWTWLSRCQCLENGGGMRLTARVHSLGS